MLFCVGEAMRRRILTISTAELFFRAKKSFQPKHGKAGVFMLGKFYPYEYVNSVFSIDYEKLYQNGFRGLIFDIDDTLVRCGENSTEEVDELFKRLHEIGFKTVLLCDNDESRVVRFTQNIDTEYVCEAGKPSPHGFVQALETLKLKKRSVVCIGDQIFTDIYGANRLKIPCILVRFIRGAEESDAHKRRLAEYIVMKLYKVRRNNRHRLGDIILD